MGLLYEHMGPGPMGPLYGVLWPYSSVLFPCGCLLRDSAYRTTPAFASIADTVASVSDVQFTDRDLDHLELGGDITWNPPADVSQVTFYMSHVAVQARIGYQHARG